MLYFRNQKITACFNGKRVTNIFTLSTLSTLGTLKYLAQYTLTELSGKSLRELG